jgi:hypothetical protein
VYSCDCVSLSDPVLESDYEINRRMDGNEGMGIFLERE